jgi:hypothetical protein
VIGEFRRPIQVMNSEDVQEVLKLAKVGNGRYTNVSAPAMPEGWDYQRLQYTIGYCEDKGYVEATEVTHGTSPHKEYILGVLTSAGEDVLTT